MHGDSSSYSKGHFGDLSGFVLVPSLQMSECFLRLKIDEYMWVAYPHLAETSLQLEKGGSGVQWGLGDLWGRK